MEIIGQGNLDNEIGTKARYEIGQLSRAFDRMTENLLKSVVSIFNFKKEIAERKQMEVALR
jgi:methyl-accepting chemotaxis protein